MRRIGETHGVLLATLLTVTIPAGPSPTAAELLHHAASNLTATRALHFTYTAHAVTPGFRLAALTGGDGSIVWPDRIVFNGTMQSTPALAAPVVTVACGPTQQYVEMGDGTFQQMQGIPDIRRLLFASDTGIVSTILTQLEQPSAPKAIRLDTAATWYLTGTVPNRLLAALPGRSAAAPKGVLRAALWIGQQDQRLRQVTLSGPMFDGDSAQTVRTLTFSHFNEHLSLTVPRGQSPCSNQP